MAGFISLKIGDVLDPPFCTTSTVIGVDHYTMKAFDGQIHTWDSYTLTADDAKPYDRWWLVNVAGRGTHVYVAADSIPAGLQFLNELSGLVTLHSDGNADLSSEKGALATYQDANGTLYAEEVFDGAHRLIFVGRPFIF